MEGLPHRTAAVFLLRYRQNTSILRYALFDKASAIKGDGLRRAVCVTRSSAAITDEPLKSARGSLQHDRHSARSRGDCAL